MSSSQTDIKNLKFNFGTKQVIDNNLDSITVGELVMVTDRAIPLAPMVNGYYILNINNSEATWDEFNNYVTTDTEQDVLGLKIIKNKFKIQSGNASGSLYIGADVNATTLTSNTRKLGRICSPTLEDETFNQCVLSVDTIGDDASTIGQYASGHYNRVEFGGRLGDTANTSPDSMAFAIATTHNGLTPSNKVYALEMDKDQVRFNVRPNFNGTNLALTSDITGKEDTSNKVTSISSSSTNTQYPSAKCVYDLVGNIEALLYDINSGSGY